MGNEAEAKAAEGAEAGGLIDVRAHLRAPLRVAAKRRIIAPQTSGSLFWLRSFWRYFELSSAILFRRKAFANSACVAFLMSAGLAFSRMAAAKASNAGPWRARL